MTITGRRAVVAACALVTMTGCIHTFNSTRFPTPAASYAEGMAELAHHARRSGASKFFRTVFFIQDVRLDNAIAAFDHAVTMLGPRDSLLPVVYFQLGRAYTLRGSYILAADTYNRLYEEFPGDTLADDALLALGDSYRSQWRGPSYDPVKGVQAMEAYSALQRAYPESPLAELARANETAINNGLARKDLENGKFYFSRGAYDSALIYFGDAVRDYPGTPAAREAQIMMVESYRRLKDLPGAAVVCRQLRASVDAGEAVRKACAGVPADTT